VTTETSQPPPTSPPAGPGSRRRRIVFFAVSGGVLAVGLLLLREVLTPFVLAIVLAYVLAPIVTWLQRIHIRQWFVPRWVAVLVLYFGLLGALAAIIAFGVPRLGAEVEKLANEAPGIVEQLRDEWIPGIERRVRAAIAPYVQASDEMQRAPDHAADREAAIRIVPRQEGGYDVTLPPRGIIVTRDGDRTFRILSTKPRRQQTTDIAAQFREVVDRFMENAQEHAFTLFVTVRELIRGIIRGIFLFFITLMISAYLLITRDRIFGFFRSLVRPDKRSRYDDLLRRIDRGLAGVVRGQLLICLINGALSAIGFYIADIKYWPILALIATVFSIIPIFGAILSSVPAVIVALQDGIGTALFVLAWIIGIHQLEANVLNPKIMGDAAKVHPVLVIFALIAGEHFYGITGALLAVPVLSVVQSLFLHFREVALGVPTGSRVPPPLAPAPAPPATTTEPRP